MPMQVSEERLGGLLAGHRPAAPRDPVIRLALESLASNDPDHAAEYRRAGGFLAELLEDSSVSAPASISAEIALRAVVATMQLDDERLESEISAFAASDEMLGIAIHALLAGPAEPSWYEQPGARRADRRRLEGRRARCRALYLTLSMLQAQAEVDALDQALAG